MDIIPINYAAIITVLLMVVSFVMLIVRNEPQEENRFQQKANEADLHLHKQKEESKAA